MAVETLWIPSSQLREGDIVLEHGMRVLIDQEIKSYPGLYGEVYHTNGKVLVKASPNLIPNSWYYPDVFRGGWTKDYDADPRWVIQGNDHAWWTVEREV